MRQTLFFIPYECFGWPVFGFGIVWTLWTLVVLIGSWVAYRKMGRWTKEATTTLLLALAVGTIFAFGVPRMGRMAGIPIQGYGTLMLVAILSALGLAIWRAPRFGFTSEQTIELAFWMCIPGVLGARIFYVVEYWDRMVAPTVWQTTLNVINFPEGGLVVYGSLFGGLAGGAFFLWRRKLSALRMMDLMGPSMMLGLALGRLGCFLNGCCYGGVCPEGYESWGVSFPAGSPPYVQQLEMGQKKLLPEDFYYGIRFQETQGDFQIAEVRENTLAARHGLQAGDRVVALFGEDVLFSQVPPEQKTEAFLSRLIFETRYEGVVDLTVVRDGQEYRSIWTTCQSAGPVSRPVYPTQLYSSISAFCLCVLVLIYSYLRRDPNGLGLRRDGEAIAMTLTLYPISRFVMEMIRTDEADFLHTGMSISQNISILVILACTSFWIWLLFFRKPSPEGKRP